MAQRQDDAILPLRLAVVEGDSMEPTLSHGDRLLCRRVGGSAVRPGQVIVVERPDRPGLVLVKRAVRREGAGWWVEGDNAGRSDDSRLFGPVPDDLVLSRVIGRLAPRPRRL